MAQNRPYGGLNADVAQHFSHIESVNRPRSIFDRSHGLKTDLDAGYLVPIFVDEALPGDTINLSMTSFCRMSTLLHPIMENLYLDCHFWCIPLRLIWDESQKFFGEREDPDTEIDTVLVPEVTVPAGGYDKYDLFDYLGLPVSVENMDHSALFSRAYNKTFNDWYRDTNIQDAVVVDTGTGPDDPANYVLLRRGKRKDYFTSALPWPQRGDPVELPLGTSAPVVATGDGNPLFKTTEATSVKLFLDSVGQSVDYSVTGTGTPTSTRQMDWEDPKLEANLSGATAATINAIRQAFQIQRLQERDARGGTRYTELIRSHFGVVSPDARLQRVEFLGGGTTRININTVQTTSPNTSGNNREVGDLGGYGIGSNTHSGIRKSFTEHCIILGIASIRADLNYQYGLHRQFSRSTRYDFFWPELAHLGEQAVISKEIYMNGTVIDDESTFGYQERYAEYKHKQSVLTGAMRSIATQSLDTWHLAQDFDVTRPTLNESFIWENPPIDRVVAVNSSTQFLLDVWFNFKHIRPIPVFSTPGMVDHF